MFQLFEAGVHELPYEVKLGKHPTGVCTESFTLMTNGRPVSFPMESHTGTDGILVIMWSSVTFSMLERASSLLRFVYV